MAKLYLSKIKSGEINPQTAQSWCLADVPALWRAEVEELLSKEADTE